MKKVIAMLMLFCAVVFAWFDYDEEDGCYCPFITSNGKKYHLEFRDGTYYDPVKNKPYSGELIWLEVECDEFKACRVSGIGKKECEEYANMKDGKQHGESKSFRENGKLECIKNYKNGVLQERKSFHKNGNVESTINYKEGKRHGESKNFYESGKLRSIGSYKNGMLHGKWKRLYENGNIESTINYDDLPHGESKFFYENGNPKSIQNYKNGSQHGEQKEFDVNGKLIKSENYIDGEKQ